MGNGIPSLLWGQMVIFNRWARLWRSVAPGRGLCGTGAGSGGNGGVGGTGRDPSPGGWGKVEGYVCRSGRGAIGAWCRSQNIVEVISRYTSLDRRGVGRCPLPGHHERGDIHPSLQVFGGADSHWYCYTWKRAGNVFDFLQLYYGLTVRQAWERLQVGTLVE